jgi:ssDNA-binding replication factor A large subunit
MQQTINLNQITLIKDLKPQQRNLNLFVIVLDISKPTQTKDGHEVRSVRVADKTGSINLSVWNELGSVLKEGDIIKLTGCFTQIWKLQMQLKVHPKGSITKTGEFMMIFNEQPDMSILPADLMKSIMEQQGGTGGMNPGGGSITLLNTKTNPSISSK